MDVDTQTRTHPPSYFSHQAALPTPKHTDKPPEPAASGGRKSTFAEWKLRGLVVGVSTAQLSARSVWASPEAGARRRSEVEHTFIFVFQICPLTFYQKLHFELHLRWWTLMMFVCKFIYRLLVFDCFRQILFAAISCLLMPGFYLSLL